MQIGVAMKIISFVYFMLLIQVATANAISLDVVRHNYPLAVKDKNICRSMILALENQLETNVHLAYLGAFQTIWANHTFNPVDKLSTFNEGKKNIDSAALLSPTDVEIIFIRHSVQKNCPWFLGYNENLVEDKTFLYEARNSISSPTLKTMVENLIQPY